MASVLPPAVDQAAGVFDGPVDVVPAGTAKTGLVNQEALGVGE